MRDNGFYVIIYHFIKAVGFGSIIVISEYVICRGHQYKISIKKGNESLTMHYKSKDKFELNEELLLFYEDKYHLVKITKFNNYWKTSVNAEEI